MNYVSQSYHPATDPIWGKLYYVSIPRDAVYSEFDIDRGYVRSGDTQTDILHMNTTKKVWKNINDIIEFRKIGVDVSLVNPDDASVMLEAIDHYLYLCKQYLSYPSLNATDAPIEDMMALDSLAEDCYMHVNSGQMRERFGVGNRLGYQYFANVAERGLPKKDMKSDRQSITDFINQYLIDKGGR